jgi:hypothetical protein
MANLVKGFVRAKTIALNDLRVGHEVMAYSAGYIKSGGGANLQARADLIIKALNLRASEYQLSMTDLRQFEFAAQSKMLEFVGKCTSADGRAQIALLAAFINDGQLARIGNLNEGRYQFLRLQYTSASGQTETVEITTHDAQGNAIMGIEVIKADGTRVSLQGFLTRSNLGSVLELLARSGNYELIDPVKASDQTNLVHGKVVNLEGQEYKIYIPQGKVDYCLGRVKGDNQQKSEGKGKGFEKYLGIITDNAFIELMINHIQFINPLQYTTSSHGRQYSIKTTMENGGFICTLISGWIIDYNSNYIRLVTAYVQDYRG